MNLRTGVLRDNLNLREVVSDDNKINGLHLDAVKVLPMDYPF